MINDHYNTCPAYLSLNDSTYITILDSSDNDKDDTPPTDLSKTTLFNSCAPQFHHKLSKLINNNTDQNAVYTKIIHWNASFNSASTPKQKTPKYISLPHHQLQTLTQWHKKPLPLYLKHHLPSHQPHTQPIPPLDQSQHFLRNQPILLLYSQLPNPAPLILHLPQTPHQTHTHPSRQQPQWSISHLHTPTYPQTTNEHASTRTVICRYPL